METKQPKWKCIGTMGDVNPIDYGGSFILHDETGVYTDECETIIVSDDDEHHVRIFRFILEKCTFTSGILSDNQYHPESKVWFADELTGIARCFDLPDIANYLCSDDSIKRALAYDAIGNYYGFENLDSYPLTLTVSQARKRYTKNQYRVVK